MSGLARGIKRKALKDQLAEYKQMVAEAKPFVTAIEKLKEAKQEGFIAGYKHRLLEEKQEAEALVNPALSVSDHDGKDNGSTETNQ